MPDAIYYILAVLLGILLSCVTRKLRKPDGVMEVSEEDEKTLYQLVLFSELEKLPKKSFVRFKVVNKN